MNIDIILLLITVKHNAERKCVINAVQSRVSMIFCYQSNEVGGSCHMEKDGLVRSVRIFHQRGIAISHFVSDRHLMIAKWIRENMPHTKHNIDVWHVAKGKLF